MSIFIQILLVGSSKTTSARVGFGPLRSSKDIEFGPNQKLVRRSIPCPILNRFRDSAGFCAHPYSTVILAVFPLHQIAHVVARPSINLKLISRKIVVIRYLNVTDRQTDGRTDGQTTYCGITALCIASYSKNVTKIVILSSAKIILLVVEFYLK